MNTVINHEATNRLQEISAELAMPISADTESVRRLRDISRKLALIANSIEQNINLESEDEAVYRSALELIRKTKKASAMHLQQQLQIGFNRASRIIKMLEDRDIVGPGTLTSRREIKINLEEPE
jgi:DNA segregation ATPase FtsK/SpoIIIE-like protein